MNILSNAEIIGMIAIMAVATAITRFLPFWIFPPSRKTPETILYLGRVLPYAVSALLVVYCLKGINLTAAPYGSPEGLAILFIAAIHLWRNNALLSITGGTFFYVFLVQVIFA